MLPSFRFVYLLTILLTSLGSFYVESAVNHSNLNDNPYFNNEIRKKITPYLLPDKHPIKDKLDKIFKSVRATADAQSLENAGFVTKFIQPRSFIRVVSHPAMPGYLFKLHLDDELREKQEKPGWYWFALRCKGAEKVRNVIRTKRIKYFTVPNKWIYPLPAEPSPPQNPSYTRQLTILVVDDMKLTSREANLNAWGTKITKKHLDELIIIMSKGKGSSYRASNIPYTENGTFTFIDTEYPEKKPDYNSIKKYLSSKMKAYWEKLVDKKKG